MLANSRTSAQELGAFWDQEHRHDPLPAEPGRLEALPLAEELPGCPRAWPKQPAGDPLRLLCVGSLEPRKNHRGLLKALAWLVAQGEPQREPHVVLQLVGWANDSRVVAMVRRAQAIGLPLHWDGEADDAALRAYYQQADLCVYPSLEEGYGLPVAESLWLGRPCLSGVNGALAEHAEAGGCMAIDMASWRALALALAQLLQDPDQLVRLQAELSARPLRSWREYAAAMLSLMEA